MKHILTKMIRPGSLFTLSLVILYACGQMKTETDVIVLNANVYTVDNNFSKAEAFAIKDGIFVAVGTTDEILKTYDAAHIIDAGGKSVYPGFIDAHCHFYGYGENLYRWANLHGTKSLDEMLDRLDAHLETHPAEWLLGRGWDQNHWSPPVFPDNKLLEQRFPGKKILLVRVDGHASLASKAALEAAGITADFKVQGGEVVLDRQGKPTGLLIDNADLPVKALIPQLTVDERKKALLEAQHNCFEVGLTSVVDAGLNTEIIELIRTMQQAGKLKMKINAMINPEPETMQRYLPEGPYVSERLTINTLKLFADGALGSRGALMLEPYTDQAGNLGLMLHDTTFYIEHSQKAYDAGFQMAIHAIGDGANRFVLDLYARFLKPGNDRRWRVEHAQVVHPDDFQKFAEYNIIPSIQSTHATSDMYWAEQRIGPERIKGAYAQQKLLAQNGWLINGTDFPIEGINPLHTFFAAVERRDLSGYPDNGFLFDQALGREDALRSMTIWAAKGSFEENMKGSIESGKHADFVMLDRDIMTVAPMEIPQAKVLSTFVHGERVFLVE